MIKGCIIALAVTLAFFHFTSVDLWFQSLFFNTETGLWVLSKQEPIIRFLLYDGPRWFLIAAGLAALFLLAGQKWIEWARIRRRGLAIVALSIMLVPTTTALLKEVTNVACPSKLETFGGTLPHVDVFDFYPDGTRPAGVQRCFPASHASAGFSLLSLIFLFRQKRTRLVVGAAALSAGTLMGACKLAIGDHFLSHTVVSLEIAVLIITMIRVATDRFRLRGSRNGVDQTAL